MEDDEALLTRLSARAFTSDAVARETIVEILEVASRAPGGDVGTRFGRYPAPAAGVAS